MTSKKKAKAGKSPKRRARSAGSGNGADAEKTFAALDKVLLGKGEESGKSGERKPAGTSGKTAAKKPKNSQPPSDDELWSAVSKTVKPLARKKPIVPDIPPSPTIPNLDSGRPPPAQRPTPVVRRATPTPQPPIQRTTRPPTLEHGKAPGVDKRTAAKLRRGLMPIEATVDLHGLNRDNARSRLTGFLTGHHAAGRRCVLVITGKGLKDDWSPGVIRSAVPGWLNEPPLRELVLSFATAQPKDGGSGAIYVLLKRTRT